MGADQIPVNPQLLAHLEGLGVDVARALDLAGLTRSMFEAPRARLTTRQFFAAWRALEQVSGDPALGLRLGGERPPQHYDLASLAALHSADVGDSLRKMARYKRLSCPEEMTIEIAAGEARLHCRWLLADAAPPPLLVDGLFAAAVSVARYGTGKAIVPRRVELMRPAVGPDLHARHFGCGVVFGAPRDLLVFDEATLAEPFVTHDESILAVIVPGLEKALRERVAADSLADRVGAVLRRHMQGQRPSIDAVAAQLHLSARTLQRRLAAEGTGYQRELDRVRQETARQMLASTDLEAGEIAFFLGFEELNSFARAFHQWEGTTPNRWREAARPRSRDASPSLPAAGNPA